MCEVNGRVGVTTYCTCYVGSFKLMFSLDEATPSCPSQMLLDLYADSVRLWTLGGGGRHLTTTAAMGCGEKSFCLPADESHTRHVLP